MLSEVLAGGLEIAEQAGMAIIGGHTISDPEPKYGMAVTGEVTPVKQNVDECRFKT